MLGTVLFSLNSFASLGTVLAVPGFWEDQCPVEGVWINQEPSNVFSKRCNNAT